MAFNVSRNGPTSASGAHHDETATLISLPNARGSRESDSLAGIMSSSRRNELFTIISTGRSEQC